MNIRSLYSSEGYHRDIAEINAKPELDEKVFSTYENCSVFIK